MNKSLIKLIVLLIIIAFISSYLVASSGYYEYTIQQRTIITNEKIKEFESDIKNNQNIDMKEYFKEEDLDYSNKFTTLVYNISENSSKLTKKIIKKLFQKLDSMVDD